MRAVYVPSGTHAHMNLSANPPYPSLSTSWKYFLAPWVFGAGFSSTTRSQSLSTPSQLSFTTLGWMVGSKGAQSRPSGVPSPSSSLSRQSAIPSLSASANPSSTEASQSLSLPSHCSGAPGWMVGSKGAQSWASEVPSPSSSVWQASPVPSPLVSVWLKLKTSGQL